MQAVVLGGAGELGSNFANACLQNGIDKVKIIDIVRQNEAWRLKWLGIFEDVDYVWKSSFDISQSDIEDSCIILDAACQPDRPLGTSAPIYTQMINLTGPTRLLDVASKMDNPPTILYPSSSNIFLGVPPEEQPLVETTVPRPINYYAWSKLAAEQMYFTFNNMHKKMNNIIIRTGSCFGPGMRSDQMIANCILHMLNRKDFQVRSPGASRTYTFTWDVLKFYEKLLDRVLSGDTDFLREYDNIIHNGGNAEDVAYSTIDVAQMIQGIISKETGSYPADLIDAPYECGERLCDGRPVMQYEKSIVAEKALGWKPEYNVVDGLKHTIKWFRLYNHPYV